MNVHSLCALVLVVVLATGCASRKDRSGLLRGVKTEQLILKCAHTDLPDLTITVPAGFVADWTKEARYDNFYLFDPADTGEVQKGMIVIDVTPESRKQIPDSVDFQKFIGTLGGKDIQWRELTFVDELDSSKVYQREVQTNVLYEPLSYVDKKMVVHAFVVGSDPKLVEILTAAVETLKVLPSKPNL